MGGFASAAFPCQNLLPVPRRPGPNPPPKLGPANARASFAELPPFPSAPKGFWACQDNSVEPSSSGDGYARHEPPHRGPRRRKVAELASDADAPADPTEADVKEIFSLFDKHGDGTIDSKMLGEAIRAVGQNPTEAEIRELVARVDPGGNRPVAFEPFLEIINRPGKRPPTSVEDINRGFAVFDKEANGYISAGELRYVLTNLGEKLSDSQVDELLQTIEVEKSGAIQYEGMSCRPAPMQAPIPLRRSISAFKFVASRIREENYGFYLRRRPLPQMCFKQVAPNPGLYGLRKNETQLFCTVSSPMRRNECCALASCPPDDVTHRGSSLDPCQQVHGKVIRLSPWQLYHFGCASRASVG
ncbi:MAG: hypothetical protein BJ554DRAFT_789, partial [Olpidium bornovanus]